MNTQKKTIFAFSLLSGVMLAHADDRFASQVVSSSNLGSSNWYSDPAAILGKPTIWNKDTWDGGPDNKMASSIVYGPWEQDIDGNPVICSIPNGGQVIVKFDSPIVDDPNNWYGKDFIVFGNAFFFADGYYNYATDLETMTVGSGYVCEPTTVSVSPDLVNWYTYSYPNADDLFPTQALAWDRQNKQWGQELDFTKPVPPSLLASSIIGKSIADAIDLYDGSAGGTAFDLAESGFSSISYIRFDGSGGEIDAISRVSTATAPEPGTMLTMAVATCWTLRRRKSQRKATSFRRNP